MEKKEDHTRSIKKEDLDRAAEIERVTEDQDLETEDTERNTAAADPGPDHAPEIEIVGRSTREEITVLMMMMTPMLEVEVIL